MNSESEINYKFRFSGKNEVCSRNKLWNFVKFCFLDSISDVPQFISTKHGNLQLLDSKGYIYNKERTRGTKTHWDCTGRRKFGCKTRLATVEGKIVTQKSSHNHLPAELSAKKDQKHTGTVMVQESLVLEPDLIV